MLVRMTVTPVSRLVLTTYHGDADDETYLVSYVELGGRSDHIAKPLGDLVGNTVDDLSVASPLAGDTDIVSVATKEEADK